jgi:hypothetical protein
MSNEHFQHRGFTRLTQQALVKCTSKCLSLVALLLSLALNATSQTAALECAFDALVSQQIAQEPHFAAMIKARMDKVRQHVQGTWVQSTQPITPTTYVIPVLVHVVHQDNETAISYAQVESQIDALNAKFLSSDIQFCIVRNRPSNVPIAKWSNTDYGVIYYSDAAPYNLANNAITQGSTHICIFDGEGRLVLQRNSTTVNEVENVGLSHLASGTYTVQIRSNKISQIARITKL